MKRGRGVSQEPAPEVNREPRFNRPLVVPPDGGSARPYTRCTTYVGAIEDTYNLSRWQMRMTALGIAERTDLRLAVAAHRDDKAKLNELCEDALEAAKGRAAATTGTALHSFTEQADKGLEPLVPEEYRADLEAYMRVTAELTALQIEQFSVLDRLQIGGTPDRIVSYKGERYISDLKTGSIDFGYLKICAQLAVYARSRGYDPATDTRLEAHGASTQRGIIVHLPAGTGTCELYWCDLKAGWEAVKVARSLREQRKIPKRALIEQIAADLPAPVPVETGPSIPALIEIAGTPDAVRALWRAHVDQWTDELTALAKARVAALSVANPHEKGKSA